MESRGKAPRRNAAERQEGQKIMSKLVDITETAEAITAHGIAYVWEEYDAPRKRIKRARPVEHRFTVSIPKSTKDAAPLAFVVEHFPEMVNDEYRAGYDEHVRAYDSKFYTPATPRTTPREKLESIVQCVTDIPAYELEELTARADRDEIRADQWHYYGHVSAESVTEDAARVCSGFISIDGELWEECAEPVYIYHASSSWGGVRHAGYVTVSTNRDSWGYNDGIGALDRIPLTFYHYGTTRRAYIDVKRPDLVTIDSTARDLVADRDRQQRYTNDAVEKVEQLEKQLQRAREELEEERADLAKQTARLETYQRAPLDYWRERIGNADASAFHRIKTRAAATARLING